MILRSEALSTLRRAIAVLSIFAPAAVVLSACATSPTGRDQLMLVPPDVAAVESKKAYISTVRQLDAEQKLLDDPELANRVQLITGRLVAIAVDEYPHTRDWDCVTTLSP